VKEGRQWNLEVLLWLILVVIAAAVRLTDLGAAPLSTPEAEEAVAAYLATSTIDGAENVAAAQPAPLLYHVNVLLFSLFSAGDWAARLLPALAGVGLTATPLLLRRYLGRWGALAGGWMLALSPSAIFFSRTLEGTMPAAFGTMLLVGCGARFWSKRTPRLATAAGLGLALALTAGPEAWGFLVGILLAVAAGLWLWRDQVKTTWAIYRTALKPALIAVGLGVLALGSGLLLNPSGLATTAGHILGWLAGFGAPFDVPRASFLTVALAYEPLILIAGLIGLGIALRREHKPGTLLALWVVVGAAQLALTRSREPAALLWLLLPLSVLGGIAIEKLVEDLAAHGRWMNEGLYLPVSLVIWVHCGLNLARFANTGDDVHWLLVWLTILLQVILMLAFGFAISVPEPEEETQQALRRGIWAAVRAGGLSLAVTLLAITFSIGWGVSHVRPNSPRELLPTQPAAPEVRTLVSVVEHAASRSVGAPPTVSVAFLGDPDLTILWSLRHFDIRILEGQMAENQPDIVITTAQDTAPAGYFGETFTTQRSWTPNWENRQERIKWILYRETNTRPLPSRQAALWIREDLATAPLPTESD
jgi:uncharacterized protein (TIGR03663 family)